MSMFYLPILSGCWGNNYKYIRYGIILQLYHVRQVGARARNLGSHGIHEDKELYSQSLVDEHENSGLYENILYRNNCCTSMVKYTILTQAL